MMPRVRRPVSPPGAGGCAASQHLAARDGLRAVAPPEVRTMQIYRGVVPFAIIQLLMLIVLAMFPAMTTWLPRIIFG